MAAASWRGKRPSRKIPNASIVNTTPIAITTSTSTPKPSAGLFASSTPPLRPIDKSRIALRKS